MSSNLPCIDPSIFNGNAGDPGQYLVAGSGITISASSGWQSLDLDLPNNEEFKKWNQEWKLSKNALLY